MTKILYCVVLDLNITEVFQSFSVVEHPCVEKGKYFTSNVRSPWGKDTTRIFKEDLNVVKEKNTSPDYVFGAVFVYIFTEDIEAGKNKIVEYLNNQFNNVEKNINTLKKHLKDL